MPSKPLLLVDVDGVISLFGFDSDRRPPGEFHNVEGSIHFLSAGAGPLLRELAADFELVWCTGWEEKANEHLPRLLGLPDRLPFLSFDRNPGRRNAHWKLAAIDTFAGPERPLAWVDDALDERCRAWGDQRTGPTLLVATDPAVGLTSDHAAKLVRWSHAPAG